MKNRYQDSLLRAQRVYHRAHPWRLNEAGLYVPHDYSEKGPADLSWWDDVGFIQAKRRVIVWWRHPRDRYLDEIGERAWTLAGDNPGDDWLTEGSTANYRKVGASRKKVVSYTCRAPSEAQRAYYARRREAEDRLRQEGIDFEVGVLFKRTRLDWALGVELVAPFEVRCEADLVPIAQLARGLITGATTLKDAFPDYRYGRQDWLEDLEKSGA